MEMSSFAANQMMRLAISKRTFGVNWLYRSCKLDHFTVVGIFCYTVKWSCLLSRASNWIFCRSHQEILELINSIFLVSQTVLYLLTFLVILWNGLAYKVEQVTEFSADLKRNFGDNWLNLSYKLDHFILKSWNTKGGSITVPLTSCLTGFANKNKNCQ